MSSAPPVPIDYAVDLVVAPTVSGGGREGAADLALETEAVNRGPFAVELGEFLEQRDEGRQALLGSDDDAILAAGGLAILAGRPGAGKTTVAVDLAFHLASGVEWLGFGVPRPARILVVENEGPREPFRRKLEHKAKAWPHPIAGALFVHTWAWGAFRVDDELSQERMREFLADERIDLVVADPLGSLGVRGAGSPADTYEFLARLVRLGLFTNTAWLLLHHFRHGSTRGEPAADELDELSGAWGGHPDAVLVARDMDADRCRLSFPKLRWRPEPLRPLILSRDRDVAGFSVVAEEGAGRPLDGEILGLLADGAWRTASEVARPAAKGGVGAGRKAVEATLETLVRAGQLEFAEGPAGKASNAKGYRLLAQPPEQARTSTLLHEGEACLLDPLPLPVGEGGSDKQDPRRLPEDEPSAESSCEDALIALIATAPLDELRRRFDEGG